MTVFSNDSSIEQTITIQHRERAVDKVRHLVTMEVIAEHKADPLKPEKSPALSKILELMRQEPVAGKLVLIAVKPGAQYQVARLSGHLGEDNDLTDRRRFSSENDGLHEIFLMRLEEMGLLNREELASDLMPNHWVASQEDISEFSRRLQKYAIGYVDRPAALPGESLTLHVSADSNRRVHAALVEIGSGLPSGEVRERMVADLGQLNVGPQKIEIGSSAQVPDLGTLREQIKSIGLSFMPTFLGVRQVLISQYESPTVHWEVALSEEGRLELYATGVYRGTQKLALSHTLTRGTWYSIAVSFGVEELAIALEGVAPSASSWGSSCSRICKQSGSRSVSPGSFSGFPLGALFFATSGEKKENSNFDGKIEAPFLSASTDCVGLATYRANLGPVEETPGLILRWSPSSSLLASEVVGKVIWAFDAFGNRISELDANCQNSPSFAVTSSSWDGLVDSFREQRRSWDAVHFHCDDLDDCRWETSLTVKIPESLKSGAYAIRLVADDIETEHVPFFVEPSVPRSSIAVIVPTASYMAYGNDHPGTQGQMAQATASRTPVLMRGDLFMQKHPELGLSCYDTHRDGSGVAYATWRRPMLNMRPTHQYHVGAWQLPADLKLLSWLSDSEIQVDLITDHSLHRRGVDALNAYTTVMTTTHSEYYTTRMLDAVEGWINSGGRFLYLGANGFYWRCALAEGRPWIFEIRRGENGSRAWESKPGEAHLAFTSERGGLWKYNGRPPHRIFGVGFCSQGFDSAGWYRRLADSFDERARFIFEGVDSEIFGSSASTGGGAAGQETDRYDVELGSPTDAMVLATSEGLSDGYLRAVEEIQFLVSGTSAFSDPRVRADMTYFVNRSDGAVFSTGSIAWSSVLGEDQNVSQITFNVIKRFADPEPLPW